MGGSTGTTEEQEGIMKAGSKAVVGGKAGEDRGADNRGRGGAGMAESAGGEVAARREPARCTEGECSERGES